MNTSIWAFLGCRFKCLRLCDSVLSDIFPTTQKGHETTPPAPPSPAPIKRASSSSRAVGPVAGPLLSTEMEAAKFATCAAVIMSSPAASRARSAET